ncbi:MAG: LptF/LptG family permease [Puniceicoccales bacterium]|jgi:lipopolysaccharide export system permease protein|nr:LptF/LptG family permease [Puniceicoccales bacterium]
MLLLDRYILREWLKVFAMTLAALVGLLLVGRAYDEVPDLIKWDASGSLAARYFALQIPAFLPLLITVSLLISVLFILGFFHRNQELTAMRAAGLSIFRITRVLWAAGGVLALLLFALNATLVPMATEKSRLLKETAEFDFRARTEGQKTATTATTAQANTRDGAASFFANNAQHRLWSIDRLSGYTGRGYGIHVWQDDGVGNPVEAWMARYGYYDSARERPCWVLEDGRHYRYESGRLVAQPRFQKIAAENLTESPALMRALNAKPRELSINEIRAVLAQTGAETSRRMASWAVQYHYVLASPFCCLIVVGLAVPFAVSGVRVNPMVGVSKSLVLFALYYLLTNLCSLLGAQQLLAPALAAWLPNLFMLALAVWLCRRVN